MLETAQAPLSLPQMARELAVSPEQLEGMIQYWVRKGKIREGGGQMGCGDCGHNGACPFVVAMPRTFELVTGAEVIPLPMVGGAGCGYQPR
jgi:hypothetical protein